MVQTMDKLDNVAVLPVPFCQFPSNAIQQVDSFVMLMIIALEHPHFVLIMLLQMVVNAVPLLQMEPIYVDTVQEHQKIVELQSQLVQPV